MTKTRKFRTLRKPYRVYHTRNQGWCASRVGVAYVTGYSTPVEAFEALIRYLTKDIYELAA